MLVFFHFQLKIPRGRHVGVTGDGKLKSAAVGVSSSDVMFSPWLMKIHQLIKNNRRDSTHGCDCMDNILLCKKSLQ